MPGLRAEPGSYQEDTELVTVERDGVGFVVRSRAADVRGR
jgi:hypothetical protein